MSKSKANLDTDNNVPKDIKAAEEPDNSTVKKDAGKGVLRISGLPSKGFFRCGRFWPHEGVDVEAGELSEEQIKILRAEKFLKVEAL